MEVITISIAQEDKAWVEQLLKENSLDTTYTESDGLIGGPVWLDVAVPLVAAALPCITKIVVKLIEKHNTAKISCGEITVENIAAKDVQKTLEKMFAMSSPNNKGKKNGSK